MMSSAFGCGVGLRGLLLAGTFFALSACGSSDSSHADARDRGNGSRTTQWANVPAARAAAAFRLVHEPVALIMPSSDGSVFQVRFRLDRALRTDRQGTLVDVKLGGAGADAPPTPFGRRTRHCYAAVIGNDFDSAGLRGVKTGGMVAFALRAFGSTVRRQLTLHGKRSDAISGLECGSR